jgi:uncharacterized SAM-binding protein YcdF (DUF218 family)
MNSLTNFYSWLESADDDADRSDVVFVLAGRECRKDFALWLFEHGRSDVLLISVGRFEIRRFMSRGLDTGADLRQMAASVAPNARHYFVTLQSTGPKIQRIPLGRFGTWSEVRAFSRWLGENRWIRTGLVVSSGFHLRRVRWCCRFLLTESVRLKFIAAPDENPKLNATQWWLAPLGRRLVLSELPKLLLYGALLWSEQLRSKRRRRG